MIIFGSIGLALPANAMDCFNDPVYDHNWTGEVTTGAFVRDVACMEESRVITTLPVGSNVTVSGETDGWWKVKLADGSTGWVGEWLISIVNESKGVEYESESQNPKSEIQTQTQTTAISASLTQRLRGHILLQVEENGEAWYVHPDEDTRYYMKDGPTAYEMMRKFGLGISNHDLSSLQSGNTEMNLRLRGRILLQVEEHGEAYYVHPTDGSINYMKDGNAAYEIMRSLSLGITNTDLARVAESEFTALPNSNIVTGSSVSVPLNDDLDYLADVNEYWLSRVNTLRATENLRQLVLDDGWIETATKYAEYMGETGSTAHERADGSSMHEWINQQGLEFSERYSTNGWNTNYFTENIAWGYTDGTKDGLIETVEDAMEYYLGEESYNGVHYRTIYHEDWNSVGASYYLEDLNNGQYKVYLVFHYGSLAM